MQPIAKIGQGNMSDTFPNQNGQQQDNTFSPLSFNFAVEYTIKNIKVARKDELNGTHQLQTNADDDNLFRSNINKTKKTQKIYSFVGTVV